MPWTGRFRDSSLAAVRGLQLALREQGSAVGTVQLVSLDSGSRRSRGWDPLLTARNARRAAADPSAVAYIGEMNSAASAISLPILNRAGIAQISPSNTAIGLTRAGPGAGLGEPGRYYPTGRRHFFRLLPNDRVQGAALAALMRRRRCRRVAVIDDAAVVGSGLGYWTCRFSGAHHLRVVFRASLRGGDRSSRRLAGRAAKRRVDCLAYSGFGTSGAARLFERLARALPGVELFASDWLIEGDFLARIPTRVARRVLMTTSILPSFAYPSGGRKFFRRYRREYRDPFPNGYAIYGFEAMRLALDAVKTAGPDRNSVIDWLTELRDRSSVLGTYGFDRYGDTTRRVFAAYRLPYFDYLGTITP
jgi:branched-chain amino acid transport system substrate-binding protein